MDVLRLKYDLKGVGADKWFLLISDLHTDSKQFSKKIFTKLMNQAVEKNADIFIFGDTFDAMGGKFDRRTSKGDVAPKFQVPDYFDSIVDDAVELYTPYKHLIRLISTGNHEDSVRRHHETDLVKRLVARLNVDSETLIYTGPYAGFINLVFQTKESENSTQRQIIYYNHGSGGNAPVTYGVLKTGRRQAMVDADVYVSGHIHRAWHVPLTKYQVSRNGLLEIKETDHIQIGTLKENDGWEDRNEFPPAVIGGCWLRFINDSSNGNGEYYIVREVIRAK